MINLIDQSIASIPLGQMGDLKGNKDGFFIPNDGTKES